ncbi:MAG TPA: hypothetical protein VGY77_05615 [Gemmataceae bacterium]|jgi:hypothetical protein|nr:hypothetical protein [Gemmataceae bacterium]
MAAVVRGKCPGCQKVLRFPPEWIPGKLRCKHCGMILQAQSKGPAPKAKEAGAPILPSTAKGNGEVDASPMLNFLAGDSPENNPFFVNETPGDDSSSAVHRYRRRARLRTLRNALVTLALLGAAGIFIYSKWDKIIAQLQHPDNVIPRTVDSPPKQTDGSAATGKGKDNNEAPPAPEAPFPRRLLAISANNYLYANPISSGSVVDQFGRPNEDRPGASRSLHNTLQRLAELLHIPPTQVVELSDAAPKEIAQPPLKAVIETTVAEFLGSCRKQDRIIVLFIGHAVEIGGASFLVPIEGELTARESLIPLSWLYDQLAKCQAQQKLLLMDVCRYNPSRGLERPGAGPMGEKLDAALKNPPPGVVVWTACIGGQYSYEGDIELPDHKLYTNGFFMNELYELVGPSKINPGIQKPESPFPLDILARGSEVGKEEKKPKGLFRGTQSKVAEWLGVQQTPRLSGVETGETVPFDPKEPLPEKLAIQVPAPPEGGAADRDLVRKILEDIEAKMAKEGEMTLRVETLPIFSAQRLAEYSDDGKMTPFREEILRAAGLLKKHARALKYDFMGSVDNPVSKQFILNEQKDPARVLGELMGALETLKESGEQRDEEKSRRWQANFDYVVARLEARIAAVLEYNYMLGLIRKDALPKREPKHLGFRLASQEKLQNTDAKKRAADSKKIFTKLAKDHQGTPWEVLAKRQALNAIGLEWKPFP